MEQKTTENHGDFWQWFRSTGWRKLLLRRATVVHLLVGVVLAQGSGRSLADLSSVVVLPLAGVLLGMTFAWAGNLSAILMSPNVRRVAKERDGATGRSWIHNFQQQTLVVVFAVGVWGLAALGLKFPDVIAKSGYFCAIARTFVFATTSVAVREAWSVIYGINRLLQIDHQIEVVQSADAPSDPGGVRVAGANDLPPSSDVVERSEPSGLGETEAGHRN